MAVLISGGMGYIGSHTAIVWLPFFAFKVGFSESFSERKKAL